MEKLLLTFNNLQAYGGETGTEKGETGTEKGETGTIEAVDWGSFPPLDCSP